LKSKQKKPMMNQTTIIVNSLFNAELGELTNFSVDFSVEDSKNFSAQREAVHEHSSIARSLRNGSFRNVIFDDLGTWASSNVNIKLSNVDFVACKFITRTQIESIKFEQVTFRDCDFEETDFIQCSFSDCSFGFTEITPLSVKFVNCSFKGLHHFSSSDLRKTSFFECRYDPSFGIENLARVEQNSGGTRLFQDAVGLKRRGSSFASPSSTYSDGGSKVEANSSSGLGIASASKDALERFGDFTKAEHSTDCSNLQSLGSQYGLDKVAFHHDPGSKFEPLVHSSLRSPFLGGEGQGILELFSAKAGETLGKAEIRLSRATGILNIAICSFLGYLLLLATVMTISSFNSDKGAIEKIEGIAKTYFGQTIDKKELWKEHAQLKSDLEFLAFKNKSQIVTDERNSVLNSISTQGAMPKDVAIEIAKKLPFSDPKSKDEVFVKGSTSFPQRTDSTINVIDKEPSDYGNGRVFVELIDRQQKLLQWSGTSLAISRNLLAVLLLFASIVSFRHYTKMTEQFVKAANNLERFNAARVALYLSITSNDRGIVAKTIFDFNQAFLSMSGTLDASEKDVDSSQGSSFIDKLKDVLIGGKG
jgi:Pentapeptide repeats (8 copies)